jgi:hypothetical protein
MQKSGVTAGCRCAAWCAESLRKVKELKFGFSGFLFSVTYKRGKSGFFNFSSRPFRTSGFNTKAF